MQVAPLLSSKGGGDTLPLKIPSRGSGRSLSISRDPIKGLWKDSREIPLRELERSLGVSRDPTKGSWRDSLYTALVCHRF